MLILHWIAVQGTSITFVKCESVERTWTEVMDAIGVITVEFSELLRQNLDRKILKLKRQCRYFVLGKGPD